jgi:microcompartment protein CcmL/EutN
MVYDMIYLTAIVLTLGDSSTVDIYTKTIHRTTQSTQAIHRTQSTQVIHRTTQSTQAIHRTTQSTQVIHRTTQSTQVIHRTTQSTQTIHRSTQFMKSADPAQPLRGLPWHMPYNRGKSTENPQSG